MRMEQTKQEKKEKNNQIKRAMRKEEKEID